MYTYPETTVWFQRRNLAVGRELERKLELTNEAVIYLLVTWAVRPQEIPEAALEHIAHRFAHCVSDAAN